MTITQIFLDRECVGVSKQDLFHNYKEGARTMKDNSEEKQGKEKQVYEEPRVITTYKKEDLEEIIKPHGEYDSGGGCGCGGGSILQN
jgi:hypothetical protein